MALPNILFEELFAPLLTTEWGKRVGWAMLVIMGLLAFLTLISTPYYWYSDLKLARTHVTSSSDYSTSEQLAMLSKQIPQWHLFGIGPDDAQTDTIPITSLQLKLVGVIKALPENMSRVIISESGQPGKVYQVGDKITAGVKIYLIMEDGVILQNGARQEKLPLQRSTLIFQGMPKQLLQGGG
jgi:type II secretory pathway component PulC